MTASIKRHIVACERLCYGIMLLLLIAPVLKASADTIVAAADQWCPISCEPDSAEPGFMVEVAQAVFTKAGHQFVYQKMPWTRAINDTRHGKINAVIGAFKGDTPDFIFPVAAQAHLSSNSFFTLKSSSWQYQNLESLNTRRIGATLRYDYGTDLNQYIRKHSYSGRIELITGVEPLRRNIEKARMGRVDTLIESEPVFWYTAKQLGVADQFQEVGHASPPEDCFIAFSPALPKSKTYAAILTAGIDEMRQTGDLAKALSKYGLKDWQR